MRVPKLRTNLLSVGKIIDQGYLVIFDEKKAEVIDKNCNIIVIADRKDITYAKRKITMTIIQKSPTQFKQRLRQKNGQEDGTLKYT